MNKLAPLVVMMCGVAGSGKTTYAQQLERNDYVRLSIDEEILETHGRKEIDRVHGHEHLESGLLFQILIDSVRRGRKLFN